MHINRNQLMMNIHEDKHANHLRSPLFNGNGGCTQDKTALLHCTCRRYTNQRLTSACMMYTTAEVSDGGQEMIYSARLRPMHYY